jgi:hypothetical protein
LVCRAYCYARLGHQSGAIENASLAAQAGNRSTALWNNRAHSYAQRSEVDKAARDLAAIAPEDLHHPAVCWNRARVALRQRLLQPQTLLPESALQDVCRAIQAGPPADRHLALLAANLHLLAGEDDRRRQAALAAPLAMLGPGMNPRPPCLTALREWRMGQAVVFLRRALECGLDSRSLDDPLWKPAHDRADFQALLKALPVPALPLRDSLPLIDPVVDLPN